MSQLLPHLLFACAGVTCGPGTMEVDGVCLPVADLGPSTSSPTSTSTSTSTGDTAGGACVHTGDTGVPCRGVIDESRTVAAADLTGDGFPDLVVGTDSDPGALVWYENRCDHFGPQQTVSTDTFFVMDMDSGDLDNDGDLDLILADLRSVFFYENLGGGTFAKQVPLAEDTRIAVALWDFDGNGWLDFVDVSNPPTAVRVHLQLSKGTFADPQEIPSKAHDDIWDIELGDVTGDGVVDIVHSMGNNLGFGYIPGNKDGTFGEEVLVPANSQVEDLRLGDVTGDGVLDAVANEGSQGTDDVIWFEGLGNGTFRLDQVVYTGGTYETSTADMNADGTADLLVARSTGVQWLEHDGANGWLGAISATPNRAQSAVAVDLDLDGLLDLAWVNDETIQWTRSLTGTLFATPRTLTDADCWSTPPD